MPPDDIARIAHIIQSARRIAAWVHRVEKDAFDADDLLQSGIAYEIQKIGEAAYHVTEEFKVQTQHIPWHKITGMRHRLVHDYFDIDAEVVWEVAINRLPELVNQLLPFAPAEEE